MRNTTRTHLLSYTAVILIGCIEVNGNLPNGSGGNGGVAGHAGATAEAGTRTHGGDGAGGRAGRGGEAGSIARAGSAGNAGVSGAAAGQGGAMDAGGAGGESGAPSGGALPDAGSGGGPQGGSEQGGAPQGGSGTDAGRGGRVGRAGSGSSGETGGSSASGSGGTSDVGGGEGTGEAGFGGWTGDETCDLGNLADHEPLERLTLSGSLGSHDPVLIAAHGRYYAFQTGPRIPVKVSDDMLTWSDAGAVFGSNPSWVATQVPGARDLWAPDISYFGGLYHLYYSASTFGSNSSCIGHASREALDSGSWTDHGAIICSNPITGGTDDWNAIDPNVVLDEAGTPWLSFGSFWGGIKLFRLDQSGARADTTLYSLAGRSGSVTAIEAPFIVRRCGYYYLFVSWDLCCRGTSSTYRIMVGRSRSVRGPYVDRAGTQMTAGGGTLVLAGDTRWRGPGHNAVVFEGNSAYNVYHSYDSSNQGRSFLRISELAWDEAGWPISAGP